MFRTVLLVALVVAPGSYAADAELNGRFLLGKSRLELAVVPAQVQLSVVSEHVGTKVGLGLHLTELCAVHVSGFYNYLSGNNSRWRSPWLRRPRVDEDLPSLNVWGALTGVEFAPVQGESNVGRLSLVLSAGLGVGGTRHELVPANGTSPATYGDTGLRFLMSVGGGFRLELTRHFVLRLEVNDLLFSDRVRSVNGCSAGDLRALTTALNGGQAIGSATVGSSCRVATFSGTDPQTGLDRTFDLYRAHDLAHPPISAAVVHNVTVQFAAAFQF